MATIKSFTDLSQSKVLANILPLESADMRYGYIAPYNYSDRMYDGGYNEIPYPKDFLIKNPNFSANEYDAELPCWSLAALLSVLKDGALDFANNRFRVYSNGVTKYMDNLVDVCFEMIIKLKEDNLL